MFRSMDTATAGLVAQRQRIEVIAGNIANKDVTRDADGNKNPFQRRFVEFYAKPAPSGGEPGIGVKVDIDRKTPPRRVEDRGHPDAGPDGFVNYPGINIQSEMVDAIAASRAYEANLTSAQFSRQMIEQNLKLLQ